MVSPISSVTTRPVAWFAEPNRTEPNRLGVWRVNHNNNNNNNNKRTTRVRRKKTTEKKNEKKEEGGEGEGGRHDGATRRWTDRRVKKTNKNPSSRVWKAPTGHISIHPKHGTTLLASSCCARSSSSARHNRRYAVTTVTPRHDRHYASHNLVLLREVVLQRARLGLRLDEQRRRVRLVTCQIRIGALNN